MRRFFLACLILGGLAWGRGAARAAEVSRAAGDPPAFSCEGAALGCAHRREGDADLFFVSNPALTNVSAEGLFRVAGKVPELWDAAGGSVAPAPVFKDEGGQTRLPLRLEPAGALLVVFRPGESKRHATRLVFTPAEAPAGAGPAFPDYGVELEKRGPLLLAWKPGTFEITLADGRTVRKQVYEVAAPFALDGPWTSSAEKGPAVYEQRVQVPEDLPGPARRLMLDLGAVRGVASVTLNGQAVGVLRQAPYVADVTRQLKVGENALRISVATRGGEPPPAPGLPGPVCIRTVFELPGR